MEFNYTKFKNEWNIKKDVILKELQFNNKKEEHYIWYAFPISKYYYGKNSPLNPSLIFDNIYKNDTAKILSDIEWLVFFIKVLSILYHRNLNYNKFFGQDAWKVCSSLDMFRYIYYNNKYNLKLKLYFNNIIYIIEKISKTNSFYDKDSKISYNNSNLSNSYTGNVYNLDIPLFDFKYNNKIYIKNLIKNLI